MSSSPTEVTLAAQKPLVLPKTDKARLMTLPQTIALKVVPIVHRIKCGKENLQTGKIDCAKNTHQCTCIGMMASFVKSDKCRMEDLQIDRNFCVKDNWGLKMAIRNVLNRAIAAITVASIVLAADN